MVFLVGTPQLNFSTHYLTSLRISLPIGVFAATIMALCFKQPTAAQPVRCSLKEKLFSLDLGGACLVMGMSQRLSIRLASNNSVWELSDIS